MARVVEVKDEAQDEVKGEAKDAKDAKDARAEATTVDNIRMGTTWFLVTDHN